VGGPPGLGLYLHLPFCRARCSYCAFVTASDDESRRARYVDVLSLEIAGVARRGRQTEGLALPPQGGRELSTIYLGGGTPSLLTVEQLAAVLAAVRRSFRPAVNAEITLEANHETVTARSAASWRRLGVTRVSLGAQTFQDDVLRSLGRRHLAADVGRAVALLRRHGPPELSLDLIAGVNPASLDRDVAEAIALAPDHLSLYLLEVDELEVGGVTPLARQAARGQRQVPDEDWFADAYAGAVRSLAAAGLARYEISNFARPGRACRHNLRYWRMQEVLGCGVASHSLMAGCRHGVTVSLEDYMTAGGSPPLTVDRVTDQERAAEAWILGLRLDQGITAGEAASRSATALPPPLAALEEMRDAGLLDYREGRWRLTGRGVLLSNEVFARLLP
jgi:oxygen-independent coproporphyrinogen-3 oxidase